MSLTTDDRRFLIMLAEGIVAGVTAERRGWEAAEEYWRAMRGALEAEDAAAYKEELSRMGYDE